MSRLKYLNTFKCIGGRCEDNCCIGWDVDIDQHTYLKYQKIKEPEMKNLFKKHIHINEAGDQPHINYAFATLTSNKKCSFLDEKHLCKIHKNLGESYLSNVCATFPRIANRIDREIEHSATVSCPEIARLLLLDADAMLWEPDLSREEPPIITYAIDQKSKSFVGKPLSKLKQIRDRCLEITLDTEMTFEKRLVQLSEFVLSIENSEEQTISKKRTFDIMSNHIVKALLKMGTTDSKRFNDFLHLTSKGEMEKGYLKYDRFIQEHPHMLPNLFGNHIVKNLFPFSEGEDTTDALRLLLCRFLIIKRHFILLASLDLLEESSGVAYLQSFSKVIEHHKYFETMMLEMLIQNQISVKTLMHSLEVK